MVSERNSHRGKTHVSGSSKLGRLLSVTVNTEAWEHTVVMYRSLISQRDLGDNLTTWGKSLRFDRRVIHLTRFLRLSNHLSRVSPTTQNASHATLGV